MEDITREDEIQIGNIEGIKNQADGTSACGTFFITKIDTRLTKTDKPYTDLTVTDGKQEINCKVWSEHLKPNGTNAINILTGKKDSFNNQAQLTINSHILCQVDEGLADAKVDANEYIAGIKGAINLVKDEQFSKILDGLILKELEDKTSAFVTSPAAVFRHHNWRHGLIVHTLDVTKIAYNSALAHKRGLNLDLVLTGALLHDIGKTKVYLMDGFETKRDEYEGLQEHLYIGTQMVEEYRHLFKDNPKKLDLLINIIGSHHREQEWGALFAPATREAEIVHIADQLSSRLEDVWEAESNNTNKEIIQTEYKGMFRNKIAPESVNHIMNGAIEIK